MRIEFVSGYLSGFIIILVTFNNKESYKTMSFCVVVEIPVISRPTIYSPVPLFRVSFLRFDFVFVFTCSSVHLRNSESS